jgi:NAD(P)-dependent dehydrogenase (short-subunit alcohol dehydrogenase family)
MDFAFSPEQEHNACYLIINSTLVAEILLGSGSEEQHARSLPPKLQESLIKAIPFRRPATAQEVAAAVRFFASDAASFITGQVLSVSGGPTMAG